MDGMINRDGSQPIDHDRRSTPVMTAWTTRGDGIDKLRCDTVPVPVPHRTQILLKMVAYSLNYRDLLVIEGVGGWRPQTDVVPISDGVGNVVATGPKVTRFAVGDRVSAMFLPKWRLGPLTRETYVSPTGGPTNPGMLADYVLLDQEDAASTPRSLSNEQAATLPIAAVTAWHAVGRRSRIGEGDTVLIHGTGGVALFALQFAVALGAQVVITSSSDEKLAKARQLGASATVNYRLHTDVAEQVLELSGGDGVDHVIETVGGDNLNNSLSAVKIGGTISFIGLIAGMAARINTYDFVSKNVTLHGIETGSRDMFDEMTRFIDQHDIKPVIDSTFPRSEIATALTRLQRGGHFGKIVITG